MSFDHPCKETCSGWKQGYEKGLLGEVKPNCSEVHKTDTELITTLHKRVKELTEALEANLRFYTCESNGIQLGLEAEDATKKALGYCPSKALEET